MESQGRKADLNRAMHLGMLENRTYGELEQIFDTLKQQSLAYTDITGRKVSAITVVFADEE